MKDYQTPHVYITVLYFMTPAKHVVLIFEPRTQPELVLPLSLPMSLC